MSVAFEVIAWVFGLGASALACSIAVYGLASFALMRPYTMARALRLAMRELVRETVLAAVTQPLLPLFYLFGRKMETFALGRAKVFTSDVPVVFVHGYMQNRVGFLGLARALARRGVGPLYGFNYPWLCSMASNADRLRRFIEHVCMETGSSSVDLVCHSMGGLVAVEMLRGAPDGGAVKVRRFVTIATPHAGVMWRGPLIGSGATNLRRGSKLLDEHRTYTLKLPTLSVFSTHDNVVHPKETSQLALRGGRDIEIEGLGHLAILFAPAVADHVADFLLESCPQESEAAVVVAPAQAMPLV